MREQKKRSWLKAISYRCLATVATFGITYGFTHNLELATSIGLLDTGVKLMLYYINERLWLRTRWGYAVSLSYATVANAQAYEKEAK